MMTGLNPIENNAPENGEDTTRKGFCKPDARSYFDGSCKNCGFNAIVTEHWTNKAIFYIYCSNPHCRHHKIGIRVEHIILFNAGHRPNWWRG